MGRKRQLLELTWYNKDQALIPTATGRYDYKWVDPKDPRYCETHTLVIDEVVTGSQSPKDPTKVYSGRADLEPTQDNLLVLGESGDVLEALTRVPELTEKYVGQVRCVYIDPPFNTEKTFDQYEDNLEHSIWLTMMRDRLLHMHKLLADDGTIWIHLNDAENHRMRLLLDEVFGAGNFIAEVVWEKADSPRRGDGFSDDHDNIIVYGKTRSPLLNKMSRTEADNARFSNPDNDPIGPWWDDNPTANKGDGSGGMCYAIQNPLTGEMMRPPAGGSWRLSQNTYFEELNKWAPYRYENLHDAKWRAENEGVPFEKASDEVCAIVLDVPLEQARTLVAERRKKPNLPRILIRSTGGLGRKAYIPADGTNPRTLWRNEEVGHNRAAKSEIKKLFPGKKPFSTPKPERLLERVIQIATRPGDIVLDVFAGSGTTAAVAQKMGRRWISCELIDTTLNDFILPRLKKVIEDKDAGGVTLTDGQRVDATVDGLPQDITAAEAFQFTQTLAKLLKEREDVEEELDLLPEGSEEDPADSVDSPEPAAATELTFKESLLKSKEIKTLKYLAKTRKTKATLNWRGGGGFTVAHLSPSCFDYDTDLGLVLLKEAATGEVLVKSVAANLNFRLTPEDLYFDGVRGAMRLAVVEGRLDRSKAEDLLAHLSDSEGLTIAATEIEDGVRQYLRSTGRGCVAVAVPNDMFKLESQEMN
ncbi:site-specific DNA-methyltransferase [Glutamicibacter sp. FBE19]|uniref:site-specific DNA-methyltransferase n=1 Tax=Glutamicibacter sp. FBE19 TaxID=2761534 RepID=UPI0018964EEF|nr:site-specific DNA-methyltransferase [Glutamicibacter sp. FBE19]MBF6672801.1 site-specific DNA-methyltransferase [Glutamicibacter sp. FBE19]